MKVTQLKIKVRPMQESDSVDLNKWFGSKTVYKKPADHWAIYVRETKKKVRLAIVAESRGAIVGFATLKYRSAYKPFQKTKTPEVKDIIVTPSFRGQGIARKLISYLEKHARQLGYKEIGIGVGLYADYGAAQRLYVKMGYVPDGRGITYECKPVVPGQSYPVDDELVLWFTKKL